MLYLLCKYKKIQKHIKTLRSPRSEFETSHLSRETRLRMKHNFVLFLSQYTNIESTTDNRRHLKRRL